MGGVGEESVKHLVWALESEIVPEVRIASGGFNPGQATPRSHDARTEGGDPATQSTSPAASFGSSAMALSPFRVDSIGGLTVS
jgi:hypothetical protein